ncbi:hypothetical protein [Vreelandella populi]|uniref:Uncharacterized protein n=1 Tax=Vreelandella populi TaxID=2498858 RepID=A0A3S0WKX1_9GAMM|nr:hypothetical protein [Halomonas populi]RUR35743.1 hypothetical protein ELY25_17305 [Halomonas populi]RUR47934.1 hypothetical protein ELY37_06660 [Halomonas populi]
MPSSACLPGNANGLMLQAYDEAHEFFYSKDNIKCVVWFFFYTESAVLRNASFNHGGNAMKILLWVIIFIFAVGLLTLTGVFKLIF